MFLTKIVLWIGCIFIIGFSGFYIYKDINIYTYLLDQISKIPANFWYILINQFGVRLLHLYCFQNM